MLPLFSIPKISQRLTQKDRLAKIAILKHLHLSRRTQRKKKALEQGDIVSYTFLKPVVLKNWARIISDTNFFPFLGTEMYNNTLEKMFEMTPAFRNYFTAPTMNTFTPYYFHVLKTIDNGAFESEPWEKKCWYFSNQIQTSDHVSMSNFFPNDTFYVGTIVWNYAEITNALIKKHNGHYYVANKRANSDDLLLENYHEDEVFYIPDRGSTYIKHIDRENAVVLDLVSKIIFFIPDEFTMTNGVQFELDEDNIDVEDRQDGEVYARLEGPEEQEFIVEVYRDGLGTATDLYDDHTPFSFVNFTPEARAFFIQKFMNLPLQVSHSLSDEAQDELIRLSTQGYVSIQRKRA